MEEQPITVSHTTVCANHPAFGPPDPPHNPWLLTMADPFETMLKVMAQRQYNNSLSQTPFFNGYYVLKMTYERQNMGINDTAILLLPWSEVSTQKYYSLYIVDHSGPLQSKVDRYTINGKEMEWRVAPILRNTKNIEHLMSAPGQRSVILAENILVFDRMVRNARPLFDEYAILHTAMPEVKGLLLDVQNFGTFANQVLDAIEQKGGGKGHFWRGREVEQDPSVSDTPLEITSKKERKGTRANQGWPTAIMAAARSFIPVRETEYEA